MGSTGRSRSFRALQVRRAATDRIPSPILAAALRAKAMVGPSPFQDYDIATESIFIHIPKTGGTSVARALYGHGARHRMLRTMELADRQRFNAYFKFAFVRDPYDRLVSAFYYLLQCPLDSFDGWWRTRFLGTLDTFDQFVDALSASPRLRRAAASHPAFMPQYRFIQSVDGQIKLDFLGRYERLQEDFDIVASRLGKQVTLGHEKQSRHAHFANYYTQETAAVVAKLYRDDFGLLGYDIDRS